MIEVGQLKVGGKTALGLKVDLPNSPPLVAVVAEKGFVMCGFLDMEAAEKLDVVGVMVSGVKTVDEMLSAEVTAATSKAKLKGIRRGMKGREAVTLLF